MGSSFTRNCYLYCNGCFTKTRIWKEKEQILYDIKEINKITNDPQFNKRCGFSIEFGIINRKRISCTFVK